MKLAIHGEIMTVRYYSSADASAPQTTGFYTKNVQNILYQCLVTGYGSRAPAGWTRVDHVVDSYSVFKINGGSNTYLKFSHTEASSSYTAACVAGGTNWINSTLGLENQFPPKARLANGVTYAFGSYTAAAAWEMWVSDTFMMFCLTHGGQIFPTIAMFCGDIMSFKASDNRACVVGGYAQVVGDQKLPLAISTQLNNINTSNNYTTPQGIFCLSDHMGMYRENICGTLSDVHHFMNPDSTAAGTSVAHHSFGVISGYRSVLPVTDMATGDDVISRVTMHCNGLPRGYIPGLWHIATTGKYTNGQLITGTGALTGRTFKAIINGTAPNLISFLIETSDTWYA